MRHSVLLALALLCMTNLSWASWWPSPDTWLQQQCLQHIKQWPQLKLAKHQHTSICRCMVTQAKQQLSVRDLWRLLHASPTELQQQYQVPAQAAFQMCRAKTLSQQK